VHPFVSARIGAFLFVLASLGALSLSITHRDRKLRIYFYIASALLVWSVFWNVHEVAHRIFVYLLCTATYLVFIVIVINDLLRSKEVTKNEIFALINCYLIAATVFSFIYELSYFLDPASLSFQAGSMVNNNVFLYFSFTTITTLGYGDIVPITPFLRHIAVLEAIFGQFYIAIVVAFILSRYIQHRTTPPPA
jgi:hypothetical protein